MAGSHLKSWEKWTNLNYLKTCGLVSRSFQFENQPIFSYFRQPRPPIMDMLGRFSRGSIAWHMGDYETISERNSKGSILVRQSKASAVPGVSTPSKLPKVPKKQEVWSALFWMSSFFNMWIRECSLTVILLLMLYGSFKSIQTVCNSHEISTVTSILWEGGYYSHVIAKENKRLWGSDFLTAYWS